MCQGLPQKLPQCVSSALLTEFCRPMTWCTPIRNNQVKWDLSVQDTPGILTNVQPSKSRRCQASIKARGLNFEHLLWWRLLFLECSFSLVSCCAMDNKHVFSFYFLLRALLSCVLYRQYHSGKHFRPCIANNKDIYKRDNTKNFNSIILHENRNL